MAKTKTTENVEVNQTTDYKLFQDVKGNRSIFKPHLNRLIEAIDKKNLLPQNPIIVNEKMQVIDGQHRLKAAEALGLPIYYIVLKGATLEEVVVNNANNRQWGTHDYMESYIAMGRKEYMILKEFANEYRISVPIARLILEGNYEIKNNGIRSFKDGKFVIKDYEEADRIASLITEVRRHSPDSAWSHRSCVRALALLQEKLDPKLLTNQLERYQLVVTRRNSVKEYLRQFESIINANKNGKAIHLF